MSEENKFFICRNEDCKEENSGGMVFQYESSQEEQTISCPHCESKYIDIDGQLYLSFPEEMVIGSSDEFDKFHTKYESCRIYFQRLVIKGIDEPYYEKKKLFFSKCMINELVIEDVYISSAYYPILFTDCVIGKVKITKSTITKTNLNSYKSLWSFFGITFFNTEIQESFKIDQCKTSLIIISSQLNCPINISKRTELEFAWIHNENKPEIKTEKGSSVTHLFEDLGRASSGAKKKIKTSEGVISGINISELHVDPDLREACILDNCSIHKLVFKEGSSIKGKLLFKNCYVGNTLNEPYCFEQDLVFHRCTFNEEFKLTRSNFNNALVFEFCTFLENTIFNDLKINDDFQISFCSFKKQLFISGNHVGNYLKCHLNTIREQIKIEDNVITRDATFRAIRSGSNITINHNEIEGYLFLRQINIKGDLDINMLNADAITINYVFTEGAFYFFSSKLRSKLTVLRMEVDKYSYLYDNTLGGTNLKRSNFKEVFYAHTLTSRDNSFINLTFSSTYKIETSNFSLPTDINKSIFEGSVDWEKMIADNISFNDNIFFDNLSLNIVDARELNYRNNIIIQDLEIYSVSAVQIKIDNNLIAEKAKVVNSKTDDIYIRENEVSKEISITYMKSRDLFFRKNICDQLTISSRCNFDGIFISECGEIGQIRIHGITIDNNLEISDNPFIFEIYLEDTIIKHGFDFEYNLVDSFQMKSSETGNARFYRNYFYRKALNEESSDLIQYTHISIEESSTNNIDFIDNQVFTEFKFRSFKSNNIDLRDNRIHKRMELYTVNAEDFFVENNAFFEDFLIRFPNIVDLIFKDNGVQTFGIYNGNFTGIGISGCWIMSGSMYGVTTRRDIRLNKNEIHEIDLENITTNDIIFNENRIIRYCKFDDVTANDISLKKNTLHDMPEAENEEDKPDPNNYGIWMNKCKVDGEITVTENHAREIIQIYQSFADILHCESNFTKSLQVRTGKYRQLLVYNNLKIGEFYCNNVSIDKDVQFYNNVFNWEFKLLHCIIGNCLEFHGNEFKDKHTLFKNFINGLLEYKGYSQTYYAFTFSPTGINRNFEFNALQNFNIHMFYAERSRQIDTIFRADLDILENKLNQVNIIDVNLNSNIFFRENDVMGSLEIGNSDLNYDEKNIIFYKALSMAGNKINNAAFYNLSFKSSASIRSNNFRGDLIFRNTDHEDCLDLTGCFIGGTFEIYKSKADTDDGDLILDNAFIDKRLTFNNYSSKNISFINATFNGFEIPQEWMMRWKKLIDKTRLSAIGQFGSSANPVKYLKWLRTMLRGDKKAYIFREDILRTNVNGKDELPYNLMKDFYLENELLNTIPVLWKDLENNIFNNYDKLARLDQSHQRENQQEDRQLIYDYAYLFRKYIQEEFMPVYYRFHSEDELSKMIEVASNLADASNNYLDEETKSDFEKIKNFFALFAGLLQSFYWHTFIHIDAIGFWDNRAYKTHIHQRLEEQYHVLRHIWGDNGELKEEDITYYKWMHYKNLSDMHSASFLGKFKPWIRRVLYEGVFGWGVQLPRIVLSTLGMVAIFTVIYYFMFQADPSLDVQWDGAPLKGPIDIWKSFVFAIQTTFSAGLGDWAPIGSGPIKIPMTINAVLGVLFVTFLIGAYGRKMLR